MKIKRPVQCRVKKIKVHIQRAINTSGLPSNQHIRKWVRAALGDCACQSELTVRLVGTMEASRLNRKWRNKKGPANVLSFPAGDAHGILHGLLGDIVLCAPVIAREAMQQGKKPIAHWAHMIIHGTLHLMGYDHKKPAETRKMESLEIKILADMGIADPYK
ncbi:MAG: rRNA maturation RNase YbeY [Gammaproteobacteria bacterium]